MFINLFACFFFFYVNTNVHKAYKDNNHHRIRDELWKLIKSKMLLTSIVLNFGTS